MYIVLNNIYMLFNKVYISESQVIMHITYNYLYISGCFL